MVSTTLKNISQIGSSSPSRGENKTYLKPPPWYIRLYKLAVSKYHLKKIGTENDTVYVHMVYQHLDIRRTCTYFTVTNQLVARLSPSTSCWISNLAAPLWWPKSPLGLAALSNGNIVLVCYIDGIGSYHLSGCLAIHPLSVCLSVCPSVRLSVCLPACLPVCLSLSNLI